MNTVPFVNPIIGFSENYFLVYIWNHEKISSALPILSVSVVISLLEMMSEVITRDVKMEY